MRHFSILLVFLITAVSASGQLRIVRSGSHAGYAAVSSKTYVGHIVAGIPTAERVSGASVSGWIGFMPVKRGTPTSVDDASGRLEAVRPNPATDVVIIPGILSTARLTVFDNAGRVVDLHYEMTESAVRLTVTDLENGVYYVSAMSDKTSSMHRFVIQR